jgi:CheY-like chemotaxis protein
MDSRSFTLKFGGVEVSVQEATEQIKAQLQDLKDQVISLRKVSRESDGKESADPVLYDRPKIILWVDDKPENNAIEISQLEGRGYRVIKAASTEEAMSTLAKETVGLILSDMGRLEHGAYVAQAGIVLLRALRQAGYDQPFLVCTTQKNAEKNDQQVKADGGDGAISSPTKLAEWIDSHFVP